MANIRKIYIRNYKTGTGSYYDATVGTKYLTVTFNSGHKERFDINTLERDIDFSKTYGLKYIAYNTEQEYLDGVESHKIRNELIKLLSITSNKITIQQLQAARNILTL